MRFQLFSDLHLEQGYPFYPNVSDADLIILAGDIDVGLKGLEYAVELIHRINKTVIISLESTSFIFMVFKVNLIFRLRLLSLSIQVLTTAFKPRIYLALLHNR
mgnify:CR=1 FL=1|tara:strand:+ start:848 stop:1156 length:309 start_codon:yes stop_codon:yes gene_type:complete